jgi:hypothetical protein
MPTASRFFRRITPFLMSSVALVATAQVPVEPTGRWQFVDDNTGIDIAHCADPATGLCARIVRLPKTASGLTEREQRLLCGSLLLGDLKPATNPGRGELVRFQGWVVDPEESLKSATPKRYSARWVLTSPVQARLDVQGPLGIVLESHALMRAVASGSECD